MCHILDATSKYVFLVPNELGERVVADGTGWEVISELTNNLEFYADKVLKLTALIIKHFGVLDPSECLMRVTLFPRCMCLCAHAHKHFSFCYRIHRP